MHKKRLIATRVDVEKVEKNCLKVLLTGGSGKLGSVLLEVLESIGHEVHTVGRTPVGQNFIRADLEDLAAMGPIVSSVDVIVHAAGKTRSGYTLSENLAMANTLAAACRSSLTPLINLSSLAVYGCVPAGNVDESFLCNPVTAYGKSKLAVEHAFCQADQPVSCQLRIGNVYTPGTYSAIVKNPVKRYLKGAEVTSLVFSRDVADVVVYLLRLSVKSWPRYMNVVRPDIGCAAWNQVIRTSGISRYRFALPTYIPHIVRLLSGTRSVPANSEYVPAALGNIGYRFLPLAEVAPTDLMLSARFQKKTIKNWNDLRILHGCDSVRPEYGGGTAARTLAVSKQLAARGAIVSVVSIHVTQESVLTRWARGRVTFFDLPGLSTRFFFPYKGLSRIFKIIGEHDVLHLLGHWSPLNVILALMARRQGVPYVFCAAGSLKIWGRSRYLKHLFNLVVGNNFVANASGYIVVVPQEFPDFEAYGIPGSELRVIPNGTDGQQPPPLVSDIVKLRESFGLARPYVLFLGRLADIKGPDLLLEAYLSVAVDVDFDLVFAGPDFGMLGQLEICRAASKLADQVHLIGFVGGDDKECLVAGCDALVIPSRSEAMSMVILEASAHAKPVVATTECGLTDVLTTNTGWVVPPNPKKLAFALLELNKSDKVAIGNELAKRVESVYGWDAVTSRYFDLYRDVLENYKYL